MSTGIIVFIRNLLIAFSGIAIISRSVKFLPEQESTFIILIMIIINAQNSLYEGLFITHTMSLNEKTSKYVLKKQLPMLFFTSILFSLITITYSNLIIKNAINYTDSFLLFFCYIINLVSLGITNIFCSNKKYSFFFLLDIIFTIITIITILLIPQKETILSALFFRVIGSAVGGLYFYITYKINTDFQSAKVDLYSINFFSGTLLSFIRDTLLPLVIGWLAGTSTLVSLRVFNICYSAPGLIANAMNKIMIRYARKIGGFQLIKNKYLIFLYLLSICYFIFWIFGGSPLFHYLFGSNTLIEINIFVISLSLFCLFWPLGQLAISSAIYYGLSKTFLFLSILWTLISFLSVFILIYSDFSLYMFYFSLTQVVNIYIIFYVNRKSHEKNNFN
ncbi:hypothetical protein ACQFZT_003580 [Providencia stuartii]